MRFRFLANSSIKKKQKKTQAQNGEHTIDMCDPYSMIIVLFTRNSILFFTEINNNFLINRLLD